MRGFERQLPIRNESNVSQKQPSHIELEYICWDPKDGELCLSRVKPGETLVEARSDTDVQIVRLTWV